MLFFVISYIQLPSIHIIASVLLRCSFYHCPLFARYIIGTCPVINRTLTEQIPDIYRTRIEGTPLLYAYYIEAACKIDISSSIVLHKTEHTSRRSDTSEASQRKSVQLSLSCIYITHSYFVRQNIIYNAANSAAKILN